MTPVLQLRGIHKQYGGVHAVRGDRDRRVGPVASDWSGDRRTGLRSASALQFVFRAMRPAVAYQLFLMRPYVLTLLALAGVVGRVRPPARLGRPIEQTQKIPACRWSQRT